MSKLDLTNLKVIELNASHIPEIVQFADRNIGTGYYKSHEAKRLLEVSQAPKNPCSFGLIDVQRHNRLIAIRLTLPPGDWIEEFAHGQAFPKKWKLPISQIGYFKSLFIDEDYRGRGLGPYLSSLAIDQLRQLGAKAVVTHAWKESPNNSSSRYLKKIGFEIIGEHPHFWSEVDYDCTGCHVRPCTCTAIEMIYYFK